MTSGIQVGRGLVGAAVLGLCGCQASSVGTVEGFRAAVEAGELERARGFLADDPRVWYDAREGEGGPWKLGAGRWKPWDEEFQSSGDLGPWHVEDGRVWAVSTEMNDYYRLIERQTPAPYRLTYFIDDEGRIEGYMISAPDPGRPAPPPVSRYDEFEAWAIEHHPDEWAYLRPGGRIDPTGDRAARTRRLANQWRATIGLPSIGRRPR